MQQRDEPTTDVLELDRLAWNVSPAVKRSFAISASVPEKSQRADNETGQKAA